MSSKVDIESKMRSSYVFGDTHSTNSLAGQDHGRQYQGGLSGDITSSQVLGRKESVMSVYG